MPTPLPTDPSGLSPAWLTFALRRPIDSVQVTRIGENEGFMGSGLYRLSLPGGDSVVAKLSPGDPALRAQFAASNAREVLFYSGWSQGLPVPDCLFAASDPDTGVSVLLLQDMGQARAVPFLDGVWPKDAQAVLRTFARIHATWWDDPALAGLSGAAILDEFDFAGPWARYATTLAQLLPDVTLPQRFVDLGDYLAAPGHMAQIYDQMQERGPLTVLHRDPQLDNILFADDGTAMLLDWQILGKGRGVWDVAYFVISSVPSVRRRRNERVWVADYHADLVARGVTGYSAEACWRDYVRSVVGKLFVTVFATVELDNSSAHKRAWRRSDLARLLAFIEDHDLTPEIWNFGDD